MTADETGLHFWGCIPIGVHKKKKKSNKVEAAGVSESTEERRIPPCRCLTNVMEKSTRSHYLL